MGEQFEHELARSMDRVREAIAPYTRFVRSQNEHLERMRTELSAVDNDMRALRHQIGGDRALPPGERAAALADRAKVWGPPRLAEPDANDMIEVEMVERPQPGDARNGAAEDVSRPDNP
jgi:hypothetical protein